MNRLIIQKKALRLNANRDRLIRLFLLFFIGTSSLALPSKGKAEIPQECRDLFDRKIKQEVGKANCVPKCLSLMTDMGTFICTSSEKYCREYCKPCEEPILIRFDGKELKIVKECRAILGRWKAVSGETASVNDLSNQTQDEGGPIPEGRYFVDPKNISRPSFLKPVFLVNQDAWGKFRVPIEAEEKTILFGRSGFFIHGGKSYGSNGCIDLDNNETPFFLWLQKITKKIPLEVKYE